MSKHETHGELFASPYDIIKAHEVAEKQLGPQFEVNFLGLPKNVGNKGDGRQYGHSVVLSVVDTRALKALFDDAYERDYYRRECLARKQIPEGPTEALELASCGITNATTATRVFVDITPDASRFAVAED